MHSLQFQSLHVLTRISYTHSHSSLTHSRTHAYARLCTLQVVTNKHIYRLDAKTYKVHKEPIAVEHVVGFAISKGEDQAVIIHLTGNNDLVVTLRGDASAVELVSLVSQAAGKEYVPLLGLYSLSSGPLFLIPFVL